MFNRTNRNEEVDLNQDVNQLVATLEELLKSYGSKSEDELKSARSRAEATLKETRARLHGSNRVARVAKQAGDQVDTYVRDNPWYGVGIGAALGVFIGALIATTTDTHR